MDEYSLPCHAFARHIVDMGVTRSERHALLICAIAVIELFAPIAAMGQDTDSPDDRNVTGVITAVLDSIYHSQGDRPKMIVVADSLMWLIQGARVVDSVTPPFDTGMVADFKRAGRTSKPFPRDFRYPRDLHILTESERLRIFADGNAEASERPPRNNDEHPYWKKLADTYPDAWGVTVFSRTGFNADSTQALVYVRHQCGGACSGEELIALKKGSREWRIVQRVPTERSERLGYKSLRYIGPDAHLITRIRQRADSERVAMEDSIRRAALPRRIRGTVYNRFTNTPLAHAQIFVRMHSQFLGDSVRRIVADAKGRYEVRNPMIGPAMLEVQCPGSGHRPGATLDAPSLYVFPMLDTIVDVGPPNLQPCWDRRRAHRISSGELERSLLSPSPNPSRDEIAIYSAVIRAARLDTVQFLVESQTGGWCDWRYDCPKLSIAHLIRRGEVDSTTLREFRKVAQDTTSLSAAPFSDLGWRIFTPGERTYINQEAGSSEDVDRAPYDYMVPWSLLRDIYAANALLSFTRVGFNDRHDEAIVAFRMKAPQDRARETLLLKLSNGTWQVSRRHLETEHPSGELVAGACVPVEPDKQSARDVSGILGDFDFQLVSSATTGRVIPWRMRFFQDSTGATVFHVLDPASGTRLKQLEPGTYIGKFRNADGLFQLDGFGYTMKIDRVAGDRFFGSWEHYSFGIPVGKDGKPRPEPAGHFCAARRDPAVIH